LFFLFAFLGEGNANLIKERKGAKGKKWEMRRKRWLGFKVKGLKMCPGAMMKSMARFLIGCERIHWLDYLFSFIFFFHPLYLSQIFFSLFNAYSPLRHFFNHAPENIQLCSSFTVDKY
jgi:hypothetical protein